MKDKFIVGVIGTQNTGKSTLIKDLREHFHGTDNEFKQVGCDYRKKIEDAGLKINRNGNLACQKIICDTLIEQLDIIKKSAPGNYITDRSPLDAYAYTTYLYRHQDPKAKDLIIQADLDEMLENVKGSLKAYDKIIFIDLDKCDNVEVVDDKFRDTNLEYRREIDQIFKETFLKLGNDITEKIVDEIKGSREERIQLFEWLLASRKDSIKNFQ